MARTVRHTNTETKAERRARRSGIALILTSAAAFGATPIFARMAYASGADASTMLFGRFLFGGLLLGLLTAVRRPALPRPRILGGVALMGLLQVAQSLSYFTALRMTTAGVAAILLYLFPAFVTLNATVVFRERMGRARGVALALVLAGTALTVQPTGGGHPAGMAFAVLTACLYAVYVTLGGRVTRPAGPLVTAAGVTAVAAVGFGMMSAARGFHWPATTMGWAAIAGMGIVWTVVSILTQMAGLERVGAVAGSTLSTVEPLVTVGLAALVLHERIGPAQVLGGALTLGAVALLARHGAPEPACPVNGLDTLDTREAAAPA